MAVDDTITKATPTSYTDCGEPSLILKADMATCHVRSNSLPTTSHPLTLGIEEQLCNLKESGSSSVCHKLAGLKHLYECIDDFLQLPSTQQNLSNHCTDRCVDEILGASLRVLDVCSTTRDIFSQTKESLKQLESSLRRRRTNESGSMSEVDAYIATRKKLNKDICNCLRNLKRKAKNLAASSLEEEEINILRRAEETSVSVLEAILSIISQQKSKTKPSGWSIVSKLMQSKRVLCESNVQASEAETIDAELLAMRSNMESNSVQVQNVLQGLEAFESSIQELEEELECVYRRMVKARVSLLNIFNN